MAKIGRPSKLTPQVEEQLCDAIRGGITFEQAADLVRVDVSTFRVWRAKNPEFSAAIKRAESELAAECFQEIQSLARAKNPCWTGFAWILERRFPQHYGVKLELRHKETATLTNEQKAAKAREILGIKIPIRIAGENGNGSNGKDGNGHHGTNGGEHTRCA